MQNFYYDIPTKVYFGEGQIKHLPALVSQYGKRVLLVYGGGSVKRSGLYDTIKSLLEDAGITSWDLAGVEPNPRLGTVCRGVELCHKNAVDVIIPFLRMRLTMSCMIRLSALVQMFSIRRDIFSMSGFLLAISSLHYSVLFRKL